LYPNTDTLIIDVTGDSTVTSSDHDLPEYTATVTISGGGHVNAVPGLAVDSGATITLTAVPGADSAFVGWSGDYSRTGNPAVITMTMDTATTATFEYPPRRTSALSRWRPWVRQWREVWR
jgi:hypothetical protein